MNLGHTVGHAIEACSGYAVSHGHAVAAGLAIMAAEALGWVPGRPSAFPHRRAPHRQRPAHDAPSPQDPGRRRPGRQKARWGPHHRRSPAHRPRQLKDRAGGGAARHHRRRWEAHRWISVSCPAPLSGPVTPPPSKLYGPPAAPICRAAPAVSAPSTADSQDAAVSAGGGHSATSRSAGHHRGSRSRPHPGLRGVRSTPRFLAKPHSSARPAHGAALTPYESIFSRKASPGSWKTASWTYGAARDMRTTPLPRPIPPSGKGVSQFFTGAAVRPAPPAGRRLHAEFLTTPLESRGLSGDDPGPGPGGPSSAGGAMSSTSPAGRATAPSRLPRTSVPGRLFGVTRRLFGPQRDPRRTGMPPPPRATRWWPVSAASWRSPAAWRIDLSRLS